MRKLTTYAAFLFVVCQGYAVAQEEIESDRGLFIDLSTGELPVRISAKTSNCYISTPFYWGASTAAFIFDAGPLMFTVSCLSGGGSNPFGGPPTVVKELIDIFGSGSGSGSDPSTFYGFHIVTEPGHTYEVDGACVRKVSQDADAESEIAVCEPGISGGRVERSRRAQTEMARAYDCDSNARKERPPTIQTCLAKRQANTATIGLGRTQNQANCWPSEGDIEERVLLSLVESGPIVIDASCLKISATGERTIKTSSFSFDAEPEHMYTLSGEDDECMRLIDITSEETIISCEPYHQDPIL